MRGKGQAAPFGAEPVGITPAYAGKRISRSSAVSGSGDHPRVCGEKSPAFSMIEIVSGSPPRMRGKGLRAGITARPGGITPAYAGKSYENRLFPSGS